jgi:hypothetical protein
MPKANPKKEKCLIHHRTGRSRLGTRDERKEVNLAKRALNKSNTGCCSKEIAVGTGFLGEVSAIRWTMTT